ncbi:MAG: RNA-binding protein [bacterium]
MSRKLYVGNLSFGVDNAALEQMFAPYGKVESASVINDRYTGQSKGFGFVEMSTQEEAKAAIAALNGKDQGGRSIKVNEAKPREDRGGGGGRGGFGGGGGGGRGRGGFGGGGGRNW